MTEKRPGQVITFYSYKGGVGRSMAVANVATLLAQRGERVLVVDFDFEAPGLHRYFFNKPSKLKERLKNPAPRSGMVEFFSELRDRLQARLPEGFPVRGEGQAAVIETAAAATLEALRGLMESRDFGYSIQLLNPNVPKGSPQRVVTLDFIPVGRTRDGNLEAGYVGRAHAFDWRDFYKKYAEVL